MGQALTLADVVRDLPRLDPELTIYAARPWKATSAALVEREPDEGGLPEGAASGGLAYFLEVDIAQDVVEDWQEYRGGEADSEDLCERLISYAANDA